MCKYLLQANDIVINGAAHIGSQILVTDNVRCGDNPLFIPVGVAEILEFVARV
jgi:hypothetical protein